MGSVLAVGCTTRGFVPGRLDGSTLPDAGTDGATTDSGPDDAGLTDGGASDSATDASVLCPVTVTVETALFAVHPPVAEEGQAIWLEGNFTTGALVAVTFPSGETVQQCATSDHRVRVTVPVNAGAGRITIGPRPDPGASAVPFRATSFHTDLGPFRSDYDQTAFARGMPKIRSGRANAVAATTRHFVYALAGDTTAETGASSTERLRVHADGALGPPNPASSLGVGRSGAASAWIGTSFCVLGGEGGGTFRDSMECSPLVTSGAREELGPFTGSSVAMPEARRDAAAVVVGNHLYVFGGRTASGPGMTGVLRATLGPASNPITAWEAISGLELPPDFAASAAAVVDESVLVLGLSGHTAVFTIDAVGELELTLVATVARPVDHATAIEIGNEALFLGSTTGEVARATGSGTFTLWSQHGSAAAARPLVALVGDQLHVLGTGISERASIIASDSTLALAATTAESGIPLVVGDELYLAPLIGGGSTTRQALDGSGARLGMPTAAGLTLPAGRGSFVSTPLGGTSAGAEVVTWLGGTDDCAPADLRTFSVTDTGLVIAGPPFDTTRPSVDALLRFVGGTLLELEPADSSCGRATALTRVFATGSVPHVASPLIEAQVNVRRSSAAFVDDAVRVAEGAVLVGTTTGTRLGMSVLPNVGASAVYVLGTRVHLMGLMGDPPTCAGGDVGGSFLLETCPVVLRETPIAALVIGNYLYVVTGSQVLAFVIR